MHALTLIMHAITLINEVLNQGSSIPPCINVCDHHYFKTNIKIYRKCFTFSMVYIRTVSYAFMVSSHNLLFLFSRFLLSLNLSQKLAMYGFSFLIMINAKKRNLKDFIVSHYVKYRNFT